MNDPVTLLHMVSDKPYHALEYSLAKMRSHLKMGVWSQLSMDLEFEIDKSTDMLRFTTAEVLHHEHTKSNMV